MVAKAGSRFDNIDHLVQLSGTYGWSVRTNQSCSGRVNYYFVPQMTLLLCVPERPNSWTAPALCLRHTKSCICFFFGLTHACAKQSTQDQSWKAGMGFI